MTNPFSPTSKSFKTVHVCAKSIIPKNPAIWLRQGWSKLELDISMLWRLLLLWSRYNYSTSIVIERLRLQMVCHAQELDYNTGPAQFHGIKKRNSLDTTAFKCTPYILLLPLHHAQMSCFSKCKSTLTKWFNIGVPQPFQLTVGVDLNQGEVRNLLTPALFWGV